MMHEQLAGSAGMQVELDPVSPQPDCGEERGQRILDFNAGGTSMGYDLDKSPHL